MITYNKKEGIIMSYSKYLKYKTNYSDRILLIKEGTFYCCYNIDALIIKNIFNYKIIDYVDFIKISIPKKKIDIFINKLRINKLPVTVVDKNVIDYNLNVSNYDDIYTYHLINDCYINMIKTYLYKLNNKDLEKIIYDLGIN